MKIDENVPVPDKDAMLSAMNYLDRAMDHIEFAVFADGGPIDAFRYHLALIALRDALTELDWDMRYDPPKDYPRNAEGML
jgi:hypothetical protein